MKLIGQQKLAFEQTVQHALKCWTVMAFAIYHATAGGKTKDLRQKCYDDILERFYTNKVRNVDYLADFLYDFFDNYMNVEIEDDSEFLVAQTIFKLYETISTNDFSYAHEVMKLEAADASVCHPATALAAGIDPSCSLYENAGATVADDGNHSASDSSSDNDDNEGYASLPIQ